MRRFARTALAVLVIGSAACGGSREEPAPRAIDDPIRVATFNFTESVVLGEIFAQALESEGFPVERVLDLGPREVVQPALQLGVVDVVPEYVGSMLAFATVDESSTGFDLDLTLRRLRSRLGGRELRILEPAPAENTNVLAVTAERAAELGLRRTSDLAPFASDLVFAGTPECPDRIFCLIGLEEVYGLEFAEFVSLPTAEVRAEALRRDEVDVALLFGTDAELVGEEFVVLEDDRELQPAENVIAVLRDPVVDHYGEEIVSRLEAVTSRLTTDELAELNRRVDVDGETPARVASSWLGTEGLMP